MQQQDNYENLTMQDKKDIVSRIVGLDKYVDVDTIMQEIADLYGISPEHVALINADADVAKAIGEDNKAQSEQTSGPILDYNATLVYGTETVVIAGTKQDLEDFMALWPKVTMMPSKVWRIGGYSHM